MSETTVEQTESGSNTTASETAANATSGVAKMVALKERGGFLGVKAGMTQVYNSDGSLLAVTVIDLQPNKITQVKTKAKEGYSAVQVAILPKKDSKAIKPELGHFKKSGNSAHYFVQEFRVTDDATVQGVDSGSELSIDFIKEGDLVDLTAICKGKGFQGGMKRFHMGGGPASHGASVSHRSLGSIGNRADPGKCFKNKKMPGQMGNVKTTVQNVRVVKVDRDLGVLLVHGSVPGSKSAIVSIRKAVKHTA